MIQTTEHFKIEIYNPNEKVLLTDKDEVLLRDNIPNCFCSDYNPYYCMRSREVYIHSIFKSENVNILIREKEEESDHLLGVLCLRPLFEQSNSSPCGWLLCNVCRMKLSPVSKKYERSIMYEVIHFLLKGDFPWSKSTVFLFVQKDNFRAVRLYTTLGFKDTDYEKHSCLVTYNRIYYIPPRERFQCMEVSTKK